MPPIIPLIAAVRVFAAVCLSFCAGDAVLIDKGTTATKHGNLLFWGPRTMAACADETNTATLCPAL